MSTEIIEKEIKEDEEKKETEAIKLDHRSLLFGTCDPLEIIKKATEIANAMSNIINKRGLYTVIRDKKYVWCEGWTTLGALLGIFPQITNVWDNSQEAIGIKRFTAECEVRTLDGKLLSRAQSECRSDEKRGEKEPKSDFNSHAIMGMAETRATSRALRMPLGWIMKLAGYEATPAEEIGENDIEKIEVKNGNGDIDNDMSDLFNNVPPDPDETAKEYLIRQIKYLRKKVNLEDDQEFKKKVKDIESFGTQSQTELSDIRNVLFKYHYKGIRISKIKT